MIVVVAACIWSATFGPTYQLPPFNCTMFYMTTSTTMRISGWNVLLGKA